MFLQISHFAFTLNETKVVTWTQGPLGDQLQFLLTNFSSCWGLGGVLLHFLADQEWQNIITVSFPPFTLIQN